MYSIHLCLNVKCFSRLALAVLQVVGAGEVSSIFQGSTSFEMEARAFLIRSLFSPLFLGHVAM